MAFLTVSLEDKMNSNGKKLKPESFHLFLIHEEGIVFCKVKTKRKNVKHFMLHKFNKYTFQDVSHSSQSIEVHLSKIISSCYHLFIAKNCLQNWSMAVALDIFKN